MTTDRHAAPISLAGGGAPGLPAFQRRIEQAIATPELSTEAFVALRIDGQGWLVDVAQLGEASTPPPLSRTGRAPPWVRGIGSFRGQVRTVLDMRQVVIGQPTLAPQQGWATPLHRRWDGALALLWPEMVGLIGKLQLESDTTLTALPQWSRGGWRDANGERWEEFDLETFTQSEFGGLQPPTNTGASSHDP